LHLYISVPFGSILPPNFIKFLQFCHQALTQVRLNIGQEALMEMDPEKIAKEIIPKLRERHGRDCPPIHLSLSPTLPDIPSEGENVEVLIERFLDHVVEISHPARRILVAVHSKKRASDLEQFYSISPFDWFHLSIVSQAISGFERGVKEILANLGYHCPEWVGVEGSESQLGAFHFGDQTSPSMVLFIQNHGSRRSCDFLIPVVESVPYFAHAI
jgi:hypothetical protein